MQKYLNLSALKSRKTILKRLSIDSILQAENLYDFNEDKGKNIDFFYSNLSNYVEVLSDERTILGLNFPNGSNIVKKQIRSDSEPAVAYARKNRLLNDILLLEHCNSFLTFEEHLTGYAIVQHDLESGRVLKNYGVFRIKSVDRCYAFENLVFVFEYNYAGRICRLKVINLSTRRVGQESFQFKDEFVESIRIHKMADSSSGQCKLVLILQKTVMNRVSKATIEMFDISDIVENSNAVWVSTTGMNFERR